MICLKCGYKMGENEGWCPRCERKRGNRKMKSFKFKCSGCGELFAGLLTLDLCYDCAVKQWEEKKELEK